jgi:hypothetical protein
MEMWGQIGSISQEPPGTPDYEFTKETAREINIVLNWVEELKQRVPVDRVRSIHQ